MRRIGFHHIGVLLLAALLLGLSAIAPASAGNVSSVCRDNGVLSHKLISDICWGCLFPIRMGPTELGGGNVPEGADDSTFCYCTDNNGIPQPGMSVGFWEPARLIDVVREPGCAMSLTGVTLPGVDKRQWGTRGFGNDGDNTGFHHYRYYAFPLLMILDLFVPGGCFTDGIIDFDLLYISELDPVWNDEELAFFTSPESAAVSNPAAILACGADSAATAAGQNLDSMWWCAGSWGNLYPLAGYAQQDGMPRMTSLVAMRAVTSLHRRGLAWRTMGSDTMCQGQIDPWLPKSQYRKNMFFPVPEARDNHIFGETTWNWGKGRTVPRAGEDATYMLWRWNDCCMLY